MKTNFNPASRYAILSQLLLLSILHKDDETATQVAERKQRKSVLHYLLNDYANDGDVRSDGDANVNVSTSAGVFLRTLT